MISDLSYGTDSPSASCRSKFPDGTKCAATSSEGDFIITTYTSTKTLYLFFDFTNTDSSSFTTKLSLKCNTDYTFSESLSKCIKE